MIHNDPLEPIPAGDAHSWQLSIDNSDLREPDPEPPRGDDTLSGAGFGGGYYAFSIKGQFSEVDDPLGLHGDTRYVIRFRIDGEHLPLWTTRGLESIDCRDGIIVANRNHPIGDDPATWTLERLTEEPAHEPEHLITEQLFFDARLRDMIVLSRTHRVDRVRVYGQSTSFPAMPNEPRYVRYDGETYRYDGELEQA